MKNHPYIIDTRARRGLSLSTLNRKTPHKLCEALKAALIVLVIGLAVIIYLSL